MAKERDAADPQADRSADIQATQDQAQRMAEREGELGYRGLSPDPTPNDAYTVGGVISGASTPETDPAAQDAAATRDREVAAAASSPVAPQVLGDASASSEKAQ